MIYEPMESRKPHVIPACDDRQHWPRGDCWCRPEWEAEIGAWVHNAWDGREAYFLGLRRLH